MRRLEQAQILRPWVDTWPVTDQNVLDDCQTRGNTGLRRPASKPINLKRVQRRGFPLDQEHLANVREVEVGIERRTAPNAPRLDATMVARRDLDEISGIALLEQQPGIAFQRRARKTVGGVARSPRKLS